MRLIKQTKKLKKRIFGIVSASFFIVAVGGLALNRLNQYWDTNEIVVILLAAAVVVICVAVCIWYGLIQLRGK